MKAAVESGEIADGISIVIDNSHPKLFFRKLRRRAMFLFDFHTATIRFLRRIYGHVVSSLSSFSGLEFGLGILPCSGAHAGQDDEAVTAVRWRLSGLPEVRAECAMKDVLPGKVASPRCDANSHDDGRPDSSLLMRPVCR